METDKLENKPKKGQRKRKKQRQEKEGDRKNKASSRGEGSWRQRAGGALFPS